jgi:hypothetical protein
VWCEYDHAKRKIVNPPHLPDWALPAKERLERSTANAANREAAEKGIAVEPQPTAAPAPEPAGEGEAVNPGDTVIHFGKMKDKTLAEVWGSGPAGQGWVRWCANTDGKGFDAQGKPENVHLQRMARAFLMTHAAYAG